jgi:hypothetical protein
MSYVVQALSDRLVNVGPCGSVKQSLVRLGVLYHRLRFTSNREYQRPPAFSEVL